MVSASGSRSSSQNKSSKEKSSRSPLRATTLESNVKKCSRVEFREPLASYRLVLGQLTVEEKYAKIRFKLVVVVLTTPQKLICFLPSPPLKSEKKIFAKDLLLTKTSKCLQVFLLHLVKNNRV